MPSMVAVGDLIERGVKFLVPYYQRGYRWQRRHIEALLHDLWEFYRALKRKEGVLYYPLQPLVVKRDQDGFFRVVDGQQRLTTLYILLAVLEEKIKESIDKFIIVYERRSEEFLKNINTCNDKESENIDFCYMCEAYNVINSWINTKDISKSDLTDWRNFIIRGSNINEDGKDLNENIRFIWYELDENQDEFEVFIRLNIGKIPLTNAELIKSFLIQKVQDKKYRFEIAKEWDDMEYAFEDDEFFGFIAQRKYLTRIEIIFQIMMQMPSFKEYELYESFFEKYKKSDYEQIWSEVREVFAMLRYWWEDRFFYHTIGYLIALKQKERQKSIIEIFALYRESLDREDFKQKLKQEIASIFIHDGKSFDAVFEELSYGLANNKIQDLLLLFNIATLMTASEKSYMRFSFAAYKKENWSLEHITPQTDKALTKEVIEELRSLNIEALKALLDKRELSEDERRELESYFVDENLSRDSIGNLTLLATKNNSALSNGYFPIKRKKIIELDRAGAFIPICTKNLFLGYYSDRFAQDVMKWRHEDAQNYTAAMQKCIREFLGEHYG